MDALLKSAQVAGVAATEQFDDKKRLPLFINKLARIYSLSCERFKGLTYEQAYEEAKVIFSEKVKEMPYCSNTMFGAGEVVTLWESLKWSAYFVTRKVKRPIYLAHVDMADVKTVKDWNCILTNPPVERKVHEELKELLGEEITYGNVSLTVYEVKAK